MKKRVGAFAALAAAGALGAAAGLLLLPDSGPVPSFSEVRGAWAASEARLVDRHGALLEEVRADPGGRRLDWVPLAEVSPALRAAIIAAEDRRFYSHRGVDWTGLAAATGLLGSGRLRGASTISMQLASMLNDGGRPRAGRRSLLEKWWQIRRARALERRWSKDQILEAYLNRVSFRGELAGIGAAAVGMFDKRPHGLDEVEALLLAALVRAPNAPAAQVGRRAAALAVALDRAPLAGRVAARAEEVLARPYAIRRRADLAPQVAARLLGRPGATAAATRSCTLDAELQRFAAAALVRQLDALRARNVRDGAVLVADNASGEVLAYVGNGGERSSARFVDGIQAPRQAGSTLKPFLYGLALERRLLTPAALVDDSPLDVPVAGGVYRPRNYDRQFQGPVTARVALASSLNVPAVRTLGLVGVEPAVELLRDLGFRGLREADYYGPSLALGSADVTLWELVGAYRALANGGSLSPLRLVFDAPQPPRAVLSAGAAFLVSDILSDREGRARTFSLESPLATRFWTAVKTGTSKDMRDNWCLGYSNRYTVGVWIGNFSGAPMWDVTGVTGAAPVWVEVMGRLHPAGPTEPPAPPPGVVERRVAVAGFAERRREWFLRGTEADRVEGEPAPAAARIAYPAPGTVVALDPDIPAERQKLFLQAEPRDDRLVWTCDGEQLGDAGSIRLWTPRPGKLRLALQAPDGRVVDTVVIEVRGGTEEPVEAAASR